MKKILFMSLQYIYCDNCFKDSLQHKLYQLDMSYKSFDDLMLMII